MFKFKDIIRMDYETYKGLITTINERQSEFSLHINKEQSALELYVDEHVVQRFFFSVEPWMESEEATSTE